MALSIREIDQRVQEIDQHFHFESIYDLLAAYGTPKSTITRLKKDRGGRLNTSRHEHELLWKDKVAYRFEQAASKDQLLEAISQLESEVTVRKPVPRFVIVADEGHLLARDTKTGDSLDIETRQLGDHFHFFAPWAKIEKAAIENVNPADVKAATKMAKLYDEIVKKNDVHTSEEIHALNVFFARLLFCFFAEDTGVFGQPKDHLFSNTVVSLSQADGSDFAQVLDDLFDVLDTPTEERSGVPLHFEQFGYVNGSLFSERTRTPDFTAKSRAIVMECAELDWSQINPDIFGSMIQAVVHPSQRGGLGMHYTSVENIMRVLRPLFLDELQEALIAAEDDTGKLKKLLDRVAAIKIFDPACGSGNFLIIAYKELRHMEHQLLERIHQIEEGSLGAGMAQTLFPDPRVKLENFFGIEIDDFACEIATLSLWLAKHQMNLEFAHMFDKNIPLIPLVDHGNIVEANATRTPWESVCPAEVGEEVYVCGNPPYLGSSMQDGGQKQDFIEYFRSTRYPKNLDYISLWFFKGAEFAAKTDASVAFVTTNSVSQGDHVALMWPRIFELGVEISFAHQSFKWTNQAKGNAGVTCAVIGLARTAKRPAIYSNGSRREVDHIGPYLTEDPNNTIVESARQPPSGLPPMVFGSKPTDGGFLNMTPSERRDLVQAAPEAEEFVRRYMGASEFINGAERYVLWIDDGSAMRASEIPEIQARLEGVRASRLRGSTTAQGMADRPYRFLQRAHKETAAIIVPRVSSERREYIPMGFLGPDTVISDAANAIYDAEPWVFGLIQSRMHMVWVRAVAGRLKTDYRYSAVLCYNTFPVPPLKDVDITRLTDGASHVLAAREQYADKTLAQLYDPDKMPDSLRGAHVELDEVVDRIYQPRRPFSSDEARLERLFMMYAKATGKASPETIEQLALLDG